LFNPVRDLPMSKAPSKSKPQKPKYRDRGPHGLSVVEAGAMIGLGRNASYEAVKNKQIPVIEIGSLKIVPRTKWLQMIGADDAA